MKTVPFPLRLKITKISIRVKFASQKQCRDKYRNSKAISAYNKLHILPSYEEFGSNEAVNAADTKAIKLYAHAIRGAGRNIGAKRLSEMAYRRECAGQNDDIEAALPLFDQLKA
jgi:hypothetical protein